MENKVRSGITKFIEKEIGNVIWSTDLGWSEMLVVTRDDINQFAFNLVEIVSSEITETISRDTAVKMFDLFASDPGVSLGTAEEVKDNWVETNVISLVMLSSSRAQVRVHRNAISDDPDEDKPNITCQDIVDSIELLHSAAFDRDIVKCIDHYYEINDNLYEFICGGHSSDDKYIYVLAKDVFAQGYRIMVFGKKAVDDTELTDNEVSDAIFKLTARAIILGTDLVGKIYIDYICTKGGAEFNLSLAKLR